MKNDLVVQIFNNIADILELQEVPWKPQAYRKAVLVIEGLTEDVQEIYECEGLKGLLNLPGIGEHLAQKIEEIILTGKLNYYDKLKKEVKVDLEGLSAIPNLGPKKIKILYAKLKIKNVADLKKALLLQKVQQLPGFGIETEKKLLEGIKFLHSGPKRFLYAQALPIVQELKVKLSKVDSVKKVEVAGSFRRGQESVGDLDILVVSSSPQKVMDYFVTLKGVKEIIAKGLTKSSIRLENGIQVDLRVVQEKEFGSAMNYFIGSKAHNVELRKLALKQGFTLSEYGLFKLSKKTSSVNRLNNINKLNDLNKSKDKLWVAGRTEEEIYQKLKMQFIPPELRENIGEIAVALKHQLPNLIVVKDVQGLFHNHSTWSDGASSLLEMAQKAETMGMKFISFADHYSTMGITNPLNEKKLHNYLKEIQQVQKKVALRVFSGIEVDINKAGDLVIPKNKLEDLDVVVAAVHTSQQMPEVEMTKRVVHCLKNWKVNILAHPTNRLINERPPVNLNLEKVFTEAQKNNVFLEINTQPNRLDLNGLQLKAAKEFGCKMALSSDAHSPEGLETYPLGVLQARRGWLEKKNVLNCWNVQKIEKNL